MASLRSLGRCARLISPKQKLVRTPGWTFDLPARRDDLATFARRLIWQRYRDAQVDQPLNVKWCEGLRINLRLGNDVSWSVFVGGMYEPNELALFAATLQPGMTVLDVGANDGLYTLVAASRVGEGGSVLALEPSSREFERLLANVDLNGLRNVKAFRLALYGHSGRCRLTRAGFGHEGSNAIGGRIVNPGITAAGSENVALETLDTFASAEDLDRLDLVKVDAEGSEFRILQGGLATIRRFRPVILMEVAPDHLSAQGSTTADLLKLVAAIDYRTWVFDSQGQPHRHDGELPNLDQPLASTNIIAAPKQWLPPPVP
jgi:FkbM family methyltransferase